jgi:hypothetical protein
VFFFGGGGHGGGMGVRTHCGRGRVFSMSASVILITRKRSDVDDHGNDAQPMDDKTHDGQLTFRPP